MYSYMIFNMSGSFFDAMMEHWSSTCNKDSWMDFYEVCDFDFMYCGGGPI